MEMLGVNINLSKSLISQQGSCEFAKRLYANGVDVSPLGPKSLLQFIASPQHFAEVVRNNELVDIVDVTVLQIQLGKLFMQAHNLGSHK